MTNLLQQLNTVDPAVWTAVAAALAALAVWGMYAIMRWRDGAEDRALARARRKYPLMAVDIGSGESWTVSETVTHGFAVDSGWQSDGAGPVDVKDQLQWGRWLPSDTEDRQMRAHDFAQEFASLAILDKKPPYFKFPDKDRIAANNAAPHPPMRARKLPNGLYEIADVPVLREKDWPGALVMDRERLEKLAEAARARQEDGYFIPARTEDGQIIGWFLNCHVKGDTLYAKLCGVDAAVFQRIERRELSHLSVFLDGPDSAADPNVEIQEVVFLKHRQGRRRCPLL